MADEFDPWAAGSGLPLDGAIATITEATFEFDNQYADGACVAAITFQVDGQEAQRQLYSVGKNFEPVDQGDAVAHTSGKQVNFNSQTNYWAFIKAAIEAPGGFREYAQGQGLTPDRAALWVGTTWKLQSQPYKTYTGAEKTRIIGAEFLGGEGAGPVDAKDANAVPGVPVDEGDENFQRLVEIAKASADHDEYLEKGMEFAAGDSAIERLVMNSKAGSPWKAAQG